MNTSNLTRISCPAGGIAVLYRDTLHNWVTISSKEHGAESFESCETQVNYIDQSLTVLCLYRPPPSKKNQLKTTQFMTEFPELLEDLATRCLKLVVIDNINLHFDSNSDPNVKSLKSLFPTLHLVQQISIPTHHRGHTLDWLIASEDISIQDIEVVDKLLSDHFVMSFSFNLRKPARATRNVSSRDIRRINLNAFKADVGALQLDSSDLLHSYNSGLREVIDKHAPLRHRRITDRPSAPWLTVQIKGAKQQRRCAERRWRKSGLTVHRQIFIHHREKVKKLFLQAKKNYVCNKIESSSSCKDLFHITDQLSGKKKDSILPSSIPTVDLPNTFGDFFSTKIQRLRDELDATSGQPDFSVLCGPTLETFSLVTEQQVKNIILKAPKKSCMLDPVPTYLVHECFDDLIPTITAIINESLVSGIVPPPFKQAIVLPLLKKPNLDRNVLKNYRPVSSLHFLSKILEKVVLQQLSDHLNATDTLEPFHSAYKADHSTETLLLRVTNDLLMACDRGSVSILSLLDLSAAFDTLDHNILLKRLTLSFGISAVVLRWLESYLTERNQTVLAGGRASQPTVLKYGVPQGSVLYGVPQGSVLGPALFTMYITPLGHVIRHRNTLYHLFADDTQLHKSSSPKHFAKLLLDIQSCAESVRDWMTCNRLRMNDDKTEIMPVGTKAKLKSVPEASSLTLSGSTIPFSYKVRNLGVYLDSNLSMDQHVNFLCRSVFLELRRIGHLRRHLTVDATKKLVSSFVLSRLDYCNSLLAGLPENKLDRLQRVQNNAARLVLGRRGRDHAKPLLRSLHWLPVRARIEYKISTLCYRSRDPSAPAYFSDLLSVYQPSRSLRSADAGLMTVPRIKLNKYGKRAFSYIGPVTWNSLPKPLHDAQSLPSFESNLKTFLFKMDLY